MGPITTALRELMAAGLTGEALIAAVNNVEQAVLSAPVRGLSADVTSEKRRERDRERKRIVRGNLRKSAESADALCVREERKKEEERKQASARARCPPDFWPNEASKMHAYRMGWTDERLAAEVVRFRDDALAHDRMYADWQAAFRKWISSPYQQTNGVQNGQVHAANPHGKNCADVARELFEEFSREERDAANGLLPKN